MLGNNPLGIEEAQAEAADLARMMWVNLIEFLENFAKFLLSPVAKQCLKKHHFFPLN